MEFHELELALKYLSGTGLTLSIAEVTGLTAGLTRLKQNEQYASIYLWGKCLGIDKDYYVAYGIRSSGGEFACPQKKFYWCTGDTYIFTETPVVTPADIAEIEKVTGRLTGNPEKDLTATEGEGEAVEGDEVPDKLVVREAQRLAYLVGLIDEDTAVVPTGAYALNESHSVMAAPGFQGLTWKEATEESCKYYQHFRPAKDLYALRVAAHDDVEFHSNFLDTLATDIPTGCWVMRVDPAQSFVQLRNLLWPGYSAYHCPGTRFFGGMYIGTMEKCLDLPFLL
jgi:radial spoke head protein 9